MSVRRSLSAFGGTLGTRAEVSKNLFLLKTGLKNAIRFIVNEQTAESYLLDLPPYIKVILPDNVFTALYDVAEKWHFKVTTLATAGEDYITLEGLKKRVPENMLEVQIDSGRRDLTRFWEQVRERNKVLSNGNSVILLSQ